MRVQEATNESHAINGADKPPSRRGFAGMDRAQVRALASRGGKAAHEQGTAHEFTSEEARAAGRKGGLASHKTRDIKS